MYVRYGTCRHPPCVRTLADKRLRRVLRLREAVGCHVEGGDRRLLATMPVPVEKEVRHIIYVLCTVQ